MASDAHSPDPGDVDLKELELLGSGDQDIGGGPELILDNANHLIPIRFNEKELSRSTSKEAPLEFGLCEKEDTIEAALPEERPNPKEELKSNKSPYKLEN